MADGVRIRAARPADLDALVGVVAECNEQMRAWSPGWEPPDPETERPGWRGRGAGGSDLCLVAVDTDGEVLGGVLARREDGSQAALIRRLFVTPAWQRRGVGKLLLALTESHLRASGASILVLETPAGSPATAFYETTGWTQSGPAPRHERLGLDMVRFEKRLT